jgi:quercetin dioxygenase-like cupin family protein
MGVIRIIRNSDIPSGTSGVSTAKWTRRVADVDDRVTINEARNEPQAISQWHHHGENTGYVYVLRGRLRIEWGPAGRNVVELAGGDFYVISPNTVHREANPEPRIRCDRVCRGLRRKFVNVDGPEPEGGSTQKGSVRVIRGADIPVGPKVTA